MPTNIWEEQSSNFSDINEFHNDELSKWRIPQWVMDIKCPSCGEELNFRGVRDIGFKLNARNLGDIFVTVMCDKCRVMETLYYRDEIDDCERFIGFLNGTSTPKNEPMIEDKMYKAMYNNTIEKMCGESKIERIDYEFDKEGDK